MICPSHPKGRGPGTRSCPTCTTIRTAAREAIERMEKAREVGMRPIYCRPGTYGLPIIKWPKPEDA